LPGYLAFSFLRGEKVDAMDQNIIRIGIDVKMEKKSVVFHPPPTFQEK
jgi:hypothetical protein